jgi:hypothetical protein
MTSFTLAGSFKGRMVEITWIDGNLSGDPEVVALTKGWAITPEGPEIVPSGSPSRPTDDLSDPYVACMLIQTLLQELEIVSGELPPIADPLEGRDY